MQLLSRQRSSSLLVWHGKRMSTFWNGYAAGIATALLPSILLFAAFVARAATLSDEGVANVGCERMRNLDFREEL